MKFNSSKRDKLIIMKRKIYNEMLQWKQDLKESLL